jgi:c-di-GMP-binding flagellar brake protein YcgR
MTQQRTIKTNQSQKTIVKKPFKIYQHKRRKYVRLEVNSPLKFKVFMPSKTDLHLDDKLSCEGTVLNISGGGVLMETDFRVNEDDFLVMEFSLVDADALTGIIGKVKRVEQDETGKILVGIEFMTPEQLEAELPSEVIDQIGVEIFSFDDQLRKMLMKYVFSQKIEKA